MSRLYSQRNRDKQKRQIEELEALKAQLEDEQKSLRSSNRVYHLSLFQAEEENQLLRRQLLERTQQVELRRRQMSFFHMRRLQEEGIMSTRLMGSRIPPRLGGPYSTLVGFDTDVTSIDLASTDPYQSWYPSHVLPLGGTRMIGSYDSTLTPSWSAESRIAMNQRQFLPGRDLAALSEPAAKRGYGEDVNETWKHKK